MVQVGDAACWLPLRPLVPLLFPPLAAGGSVVVAMQSLGFVAVVAETVLTNSVLPRRHNTEHASVVVRKRTLSGVSGCRYVPNQVYSYDLSRKTKALIDGRHACLHMDLSLYPSIQPVFELSTWVALR